MTTDINSTYECPADILIENLDKILKFACSHTDENGRMILENEIDCKDSGWLVLAGVIRLINKNLSPIEYRLRDAVNDWTYASCNVDDCRSAWTTFALLYSIYLSGGKDGFYYSGLDENVQQRLDQFLMQFDMTFLREASRNYQVAVGLINELRFQFGYIDNADCAPEDSVKVMLDGYLGDGFFNDDDCRGSSQDRRIDAYSAEIIGLLLHYDEVNQWQSVWHEQIRKIVSDFCAANRYLIDASGEYSKWGRSLRGEAEVKKIFVWEYAEREGLVAKKGDGIAASLAQLEFFIKNGMSSDGQVYKDKAENNGIWDEYTTHVQAQGYGAYGLAMALHFSLNSKTSVKLAAREQSYVKYLPGPSILVANHSQSKMHCIVPLANRLTKLMCLWHNRITGENDVSVDMSPKFMPIPYFGKSLPAPYEDYRVPFLPLLRNTNGLLVPRNLHPIPVEVQNKNGMLKTRQHFHYCRPKEFEAASAIELDAELFLNPNGLEYRFSLSGKVSENQELVIYFYHGDSAVEISMNELCFSVNSALINIIFNSAKIKASPYTGPASIYSAESPAIIANVQPFDGLSFSYRMDWEYHG